MSTEAAKALESTRLTTPKTLVVIGGTGGIGAASARQFAALGCSRILIVGRTAERAGRVIEACAAASPVGEYRFIKADIGTRAGMKAAAADIQTALGDNKIDYLLMTQNGAPFASAPENVDGDVASYAIQVLSRFVISQTLVEAGALAPGAVVLTVDVPGKDLATLATDDLQMKRAKSTYWTGMSFWFAQSSRDGVVLDTFILEQNKRYPQYRFFHVFPGFVGSETFKYEAFPFPLNWMLWGAVRAGLAGTTNAMASVVAYIVLNPDEAEKRAEGRFISEKLTPLPAGKWAQDEGHRQAVWSQLQEVLKS